MTPKEIHVAADALAKEIGPECHLTFSIKGEASDPGDGVITAYCRPNGDFASNSPCILVRAHDWQGAIDAVRERWSAMSGDIHRQAVRKMALAIIKITADIGTCHGAALRMDGFRSDEIDRYGSEACADADKIASNGPFSIIELKGANAA